MNESLTIDNTERLRRWRLILGGAQDGTGYSLDEHDLAIDSVLEALYEAERHGGLEKSAPKVSRWLGDIRTFFPSSVVKVMQQDAMERLNLTEMLLEPEMMLSVEMDVHLVATLMSLSSVMPAKAKETAKIVIRKVVDELEKRLQEPMRQAIMGSLNRSLRNNNPRHNEIDWNRTIRRNLKNYLPEYNTIVPEQRVGYGRKQSSLKDIVLCVDQSGSMGASVVYSGIFGAVLSSIKAVSTRMVVFDTAVADLSENLQDPVEILFGVQLGGGTDINLALTYCQSLIRKPQDTILVLITDLYEGGNRMEMIKRAHEIKESGVNMITLLALNDDGTPAYDHANASSLASLGIPSFACTPDQFPDLMSAAINKRNLNEWAAERGIALARQ
ncbi:MAG: VWA domain-containing protein [Fibrobacterota bacterium]|nr:VWA domain-containing protein [Chitinispirillaceae bacterium]